MCVCERERERERERDLCVKIRFFKGPTITNIG